MAAQQQVVRVKVPQGATVGSTVQATLPNGQQVKVQLPPGVVPGQVISIAVQAAASPRTTQNLPPQAASNVQAMKAVRLTVPATIPASRTIRFTLDGAVREVPLPPGARPGQTLDLQVPAAAPQPVKKKSSSWFGSKTKKKSGKKPEAAPPPPGTRRVRVVVPPNLGSATSFGISVDGVSMVVNVPKGVKAGESVNVDVPLPTSPAREVGAGAEPRRARTGAGARGRLVRLVGAGAGARAQAGLVRLAHGARPAGGRGRAAAVGAQETRRDVERRAERHDGREGCSPSAAASRSSGGSAKRLSPALARPRNSRRRPTTSWSRRSASSTCSTSSR